MSEEQFPQDQDAPKQDQQFGQNPANPNAQSNQFPPQNGGFPPNNAGGGFNGMQQNLPNATIVLVLGILSILTCCCYGVIGLILGIIALVLSKKDRAAYATNFSVYTESSYKNLNAGRICAIIGLILNILTILFYIVIIAMFGLATLSDQQALQDAIQNLG